MAKFSVQIIGVDEEEIDDFDTTNLHESVAECGASIMDSYIDAVKIIICDKENKSYLVTRSVNVEELDI